MAASAAVSASLSELDPYRLSNVRQTGRTVGVGAYGNVVEVAIPGALCAAKKVHDFFLDPGQTPPEGIHKSMREFVNECMSTLRHPHIVQFLGVCDLPGSRIPALVMEKLVTSLHDILDPEPKPTTKPYIPVGLKCSILHNVASGVSFMHSQTPPIIHRDLSAKNVLLTEGMVAKVADLGMARNVPSLQAALMTKTPGAPIYMPPEAVQDESLYDITIDIFSLGVLALFTLSQMFPDPLSATYVDSKSGKVVGRTELERRWKYMQEVRKQFQQGHPLIKMIEGCLKDSIEERPKIDQILLWLTQTRAEANVDFIDGHKLVLIQALQSKTEELRAKDEHIALRIQQNEIQKEQLEYRVAQVNYLEVQVESLLQQPQKRSSCSRAERHAKSQGVVLLEEDEADPRPISELGSKEPKQSLFKEGVTPTRMMQQNAPVTTARGGFTYHELLLQDARVIDQEQAKEVTQLPTASATSGGENGGQVSSTILILVGDMSVKLRKTSSPIYRELGKARGALTATAAAPVKQAEEDTSKPLFTGHSRTGKPPVVQQAASLSAVGTERPHKSMAAERHLGKREEKAKMSPPSKAQALPNKDTAVLGTTMILKKQTTAPHVPRRFPPPPPTSESTVRLKLKGCVPPPDKTPVKQIMSQSVPTGALETQTLLNENLILAASPLGKEKETTPLSASLKSQSVLVTATTVATSSPMKEATPSSVCEQPLRPQRLNGATNTTGTAHPLEQAKEVVPPSLVKELEHKTAAAAATHGTRSTPLQGSCKSKSLLEGPAAVAGLSQKKKETQPAAPCSNITPVKAPLASATAQLSFTRSFVPPVTGKATPLSMSVTDAGPVKSHLLLHDNTSPSSELAEKSTAPSISEESQNGVLLQVAQFPEGAQQSTVSSTIAEGQHKSQNTPLQITNSSEQSAPSTSREMVEGKHVTFRKQQSYIPKYQALLLSATESTKTQHVARGPIKCQTLPRKATVEPPQKESKEGSHLMRRNTMPTNTSRPAACPYNNLPKSAPMIGVPPRESPLSSDQRKEGNDMM